MVDGAFPASRRLVIGIGNTERGDDAVGRLVARLLRGRVPDDVEIRERDGEASTLLDLLGTADAAYLIDAAVSGAAAGTVNRFDCVSEPLPKSARAVSTHGFGVTEAVDLARVLGRLPACCVLYTIEAGTVASGAPLSTPARTAAEAVAERVAAELAREHGSRKNGDSASSDR